MRRLGVAVAIVVTMVVTGTVAGLAEFLQYSAGKQPDFFDLARDVAGTGLALFGWSIWRRSYADGISESARILVRISSVLVAILILTPLLYWLAVIALNRSTFPTIVSFDDWWERHLYYSVNSEIDVAGARIDASIETGSAIELSLSGWGAKRAGNIARSLGLDRLRVPDIYGFHGQGPRNLSNRSHK